MKYLVPARSNGLDIMTDFDRMVEGFFEDLPGWNLNVKSPSVDVREEDDKYVLEADLPGMTEKDIDVKVEENLLTITAHAENKKEEKKKGYIVKERTSESFKRSFALPSDVNKDAIKAKFRNGVLELEIAKKEEARPRSIQIKVE